MGEIISPDFGGGSSSGIGTKSGILLHGTFARGTVSVASAKRAVGKSFLAANLSAAFALKHRRVLAIDGDLGNPQLSGLFGVKPKRTLADVLFMGTHINDAIERVRPSLHVVSSDPTHKKLAELNAPMRTVLLGQLENLRTQFNLGVIDTGSGITDVTLSLSSAAHKVVIVATPDPLSVVDALATIKALAHEKQVRHFYLLPNRMRAHGIGHSIYTTVAEAADRVLGVEVRELPEIPEDSFVHGSELRGIPLVWLLPGSPASQAIGRAADALLQDEPPPQNRHYLWK